MAQYVSQRTLYCNAKVSIIQASSNIISLSAIILQRVQHANKD